MLVAALPIENGDFVVERAAPSLMARQTLFEILVVGIDETCNIRI